MKVGACVQQEGCRMSAHCITSAVLTAGGAVVVLSVSFEPVASAGFFFAEEPMSRGFVSCISIRLRQQNYIKLFLRGCCCRSWSKMESWWSYGRQ